MLQRKFLLTIASVCILYLASGQLLDLPRKSPKARIEEQLGTVNISIDYSRPGANGRSIWGGVVHMKNPLPWRAGANENTVITFSNEVTVNGNELAAGSYGLFIIPSQDKWTFVFSKEQQSWGSFNYDQREDALRVEVSASEIDHVERLSFDFTNHEEGAVDVRMAWGDRSVAFTVSADVNGIALEDIKSQLKGSVMFDWRSWNEAANFCLDFDYELEQGLEWAELSIEGGYGSEPTMTNHLTKAKILKKLGREKEAEQALKDGEKFATMREMNWYGRYLMGEGRNDEALDVFTKNYREYPSQFIPAAGMGRIHEALGNKKKAIAFYEEAASLTSEGRARYYQFLAQKLKSN